MLASFITFSMLPLTVDTFAEVLWHKVKGFGWGGGVYVYLLILLLLVVGT